MSALMLAGRGIIGGFFVLAGVNKLVNYADTVSYMEEGGLPGILLPLVIALELGGGLIVASGRPRRWLLPITLALSVFCIATNIFFHAFWTLEGAQAQTELSLFFKNVAIVGGLLMVASSSAHSSVMGSLSKT